MLRRTALTLMLLLTLAVVALPVAAAEEAGGVNLPGWVGWVLSILALVLVVVGSVFMRRNAGT